MINKTTHLTDDQINDLVAIIERNARTDEEADTATDATVRYIAINRIFDTICPIANIVLAIIAAMLTHNIAIIAAAIIAADALPAIAYGAAASSQARAFENAINARLDTVIATL